MSNNKQSSIEFIIESLMSRNLYTKELLEEFEKAKAMHKEEHGKTWDESMDNFIARGENYVRAYVDFEDYYNETFGQ